MVSLASPPAMEEIADLLPSSHSASMAETNSSNVAELAGRLHSHLTRRGDHQGASLLLALRESAVPESVDSRQGGGCPVYSSMNRKDSPARRALSTLLPNSARVKQPLHLEGSPASSSIETKRCSSKGAPSLCNAAVQAELCGKGLVVGSNFHVCCHELLQDAIRQRDEALSELRSSREFTRQAISQALAVAGSVASAPAEDQEELWELLARAERMIDAEKEEHGQLKNKYRLAVEKVAELNMAMHELRAHKSQKEEALPHRADKVDTSPSCLSQMHTPRSSVSCQTDTQEVWLEQLEDADRRMEVLEETEMPEEWQEAVESTSMYGKSQGSFESFYGTVDSWEEQNNGCNMSASCQTEENSFPTSEMTIVGWKEERARWMQLLDEADKRAEMVLEELARRQGEEQSLVLFLSQKCEILQRERDMAILEQRDMANRACAALSPPQGRGLVQTRQRSSSPPALPSVPEHHVAMHEEEHHLQDGQSPAMKLFEFAHCPVECVSELSGEGYAVVDLWAGDQREAQRETHVGSQEECYDLHSGPAGPQVVDLHMAAVGHHHGSPNDSHGQREERATPNREEILPSEEVRVHGHWICDADSTSPKRRAAPDDLSLVCSPEKMPSQARALPPLNAHHQTTASPTRAPPSSPEASPDMMSSDKVCDFSKTTELCKQTARLLLDCETGHDDDAAEGAVHDTNSSPRTHSNNVTKAVPTRILSLTAAFEAMPPLEPLPSPRDPKSGEPRAVANHRDTVVLDPKSGHPSPRRAHSWSNMDTVHDPKSGLPSPRRTLSSGSSARESPRPCPPCSPMTKGSVGPQDPKTHGLKQGVCSPMAVTPRDPSTYNKSGADTAEDVDDERLYAIMTGVKLPNNLPALHPSEDVGSDTHSAHTHESADEEDSSPRLHRFFTKPVRIIEHNVVGWMGLNEDSDMEPMEVMHDVQPVEVGAWMNLELPWEKKKDINSEQSKRGPLLFWYF